MSGQDKLRGFTLVELIIVVGMMSTLAVVTMLNFKGNTIEDRVQAGANMLQSTMTLARTYARTGKVCCGVKTNGYGIVLDTTISPQQIILYGNVDANFNYNDGVDTIVTTVVLDDKVELNSPISDFLFTVGTNTTVMMNGEDWAIRGTMAMAIQEVVAPHMIKQTVTLYYPSGLIDQP